MKAMRLIILLLLLLVGIGLVVMFIYTGVTTPLQSTLAPRANAYVPKQKTITTLLSGTFSSQEPFLLKLIFGF
jgi:hypothetical protein